jgi:hypothetical protein
MSILNYRNYLGGLLCYNHGNILIITVTEHFARKITWLGGRGYSLGQGSTPCDWPRRIRNNLSDIVNYGHSRLEISVITKLREILDYDG